MNIRPYQRQAIDAVRRDWMAGHRDTLITMATGGGKTIVFLQLLVEELEAHPAARCLILAHRKELIEQPIERLAAHWPEWAARAGVVMADRDDCDKQIIVATVQTLAANGRLANILEHGAIDYLITDEAHHATADSYTTVYARLKEANPRLLHLGVTATPLRADGVGMVRTYAKESAHYGIKELVKLGYLAPPRWLGIATRFSLAGVGKSGDDFNQGKLSSVFETDLCFALVVESHQKYANGRSAIAFTVSVEGAHNLAAAFVQAGIPAAAADATTNKDERAGLLQRFRAGELKVLCNMGLWTEGLDLPELSCVHMVRPTQSDGLYTQCVGRALRVVPGKEDALILDYLPKETRNIAMMGDVLGVDVSPEVYVNEEAAEGEIAAAMMFDGSKVIWNKDNPVVLLSRQIDYLNLSPWKWVKPDRLGWAVIGLGKNEKDNIERSLALSPVAEQMQLWAVWKGPTDNWHRAKLLQAGDMETVTEKADGLIQKYGSPVLAAKEKRWRHQPASEGQIKFAAKLGVWRDAMNKGAAADAITFKMAMNALRRGGAPC